MSSYHFKQYSSLNNLPPMTKKDITRIVNTGENIIYFNWLELVESACIEFGYQPCHIIGFHGEKVIGLAVNFLLPGFKIKNGKVKKNILKLFLAMIPLSFETNIFLQGPEYQEGFLQGYLSTIQKRRWPTVYFFLPFGLYENSFEKIIGQKHLKRSYYPSASLEINFNDFDQYLTSLKCRRRRSILKAINRFESYGCFFEHCDNPGSIQERLYELATNVAQKNNAEDSPFHLTRSILQALESRMKNHFHLILARKGDKIIGFFLVFEKNKIFDCRFAGLDYSYTKDTSVYFNLFYEVIRLATRLKIDRIEMGITQMHIKRRLGCSINQHHIFITTSYNWMTQLADLLGMVDKNRFQDPSIEIKQ